MDVDDTLVSDAIRAIGRCAQVVPEATEQCSSALMKFMKGDHGNTASIFLPFDLIERIFF